MVSTDLQLRLEDDYMLNSTNGRELTAYSSNAYSLNHNLLAKMQRQRNNLEKYMKEQGFCVTHTYGLPAKSSVQMAEVSDSTHANGDRTQYEMVDMAYVESEREVESLMHTVANRAHKLKSTVDASLDDVHHCSIFGVLRCNVWRSIVVVLFHNKINFLLPFGPAAAIAASWNMKHGCGAEGERNDGGSEEDDLPELTLWEAILWLAIMTAFVSFLSSYLVNAIQGASDNWKMSVSFMSVILLPLVGNAAEHASAVMFAMKDKLDISLGVTIGSSTQISMFMIPFCVVVGWIIVDHS